MTHYCTEHDVALIGRETALYCPVCRDMRLYGTGIVRENSSGHNEHVPPQDVYIQPDKK